MLYQVRANLFFNVEDEATGFFHDCELALAKTAPINLGSPAQELPLIELIENHHDEDPNTPCSVMVFKTINP